MSSCRTRAERLPIASRGCGTDARWITRAYLATREASENRARTAAAPNRRAQRAARGNQTCRPTPPGQAARPPHAVSAKSISSSDHRHVAEGGSVALVAAGARIFCRPRTPRPGRTERGESRSKRSTGCDCSVARSPPSDADPARVGFAQPRRPLRTATPREPEEGTRRDGVERGATACGRVINGHGRSKSGKAHPRQDGGHVVDAAREVWLAAVPRDHARPPRAQPARRSGELQLRRVCSAYGGWSCRRAIFASHEARKNCGAADPVCCLAPIVFPTSPAQPPDVNQNRCD